MSARYGLPDHLIELVGSTITDLAAHIFDHRVSPELFALAWNWSDRVMDGDHEDLLTQDDAGQLLKIFEGCVEYVYANPSDYALDLALAVHADEILTFFREVAHPNRIAA